MLLCQVNMWNEELDPQDQSCTELYLWAQLVLSEVSRKQRHGSWLSWLYNVELWAAESLKWQDIIICMEIKLGNTALHCHKVLHVLLRWSSYTTMDA